MTSWARRSDPDFTSRLRYGRGAIALHWLTAAAFAFQIGLGWRMDAPRGPQTFAVFQLHKSIGITILLLTLLRLGWRIAHRPPAFPATMSRLEKLAAQSVHIAFYGLLLALPLTGWLMVSASKTAVPTILYGIVPWPNVPGIATLAPAAKAGVDTAADTAHGLLVWLALAMIALHVAGALKHQLFERGGDLARMVPAPHRWLSAIALAIVALIVGMMALGRTLPLRAIATTPAPAAAVIPAPIAAPAPVAAPAAPAPPAMTTPNDQPAAAEAPAAATPAGWTVRPAASSIGFHTAWSQGPVDGRFGKWRAAIRFDPAALEASSVKVTIDMASATTGTPDTQNALPEADWFAVATHPAATFEATRFRHLSGDRYQAMGTLALRGVSRPLTLPFTLSIAGDVATMRGTATIDRTVFGIGQGEWAATTDLPANVGVTIAIKADRAR